jgi:hypothetical protein
MDLDQGVLKLLIVLRGHGPWRPNHIHNLLELVEFGPVRGVEPVIISEVNVSAVGHKQFYNLFETETGRVVQRGESAFVADSGVGTCIEQQVGDLKVVLFDAVVEWRPLPHIVVLLSGAKWYFGVGIAPVLQDDLHDVQVFGLDCEMQWRAAVDIARIDVGLLI